MSCLNLKTVALHLSCQNPLFVQSIKYFIYLLYKMGRPIKSRETFLCISVHMLMNALIQKFLWFTNNVQHLGLAPVHRLHLLLALLQHQSLLPKNNNYVLTQTLPSSSVGVSNVFSFLVRSLSFLLHNPNMVEHHTQRTSEIEKLFSQWLPGFNEWERTSKVKIKYKNKP